MRFIVKMRYVNCSEPHIETKNTPPTVREIVHTFKETGNVTDSPKSERPGTENFSILNHRIL